MPFERNGFYYTSVSYTIKGTDGKTYHGRVRRKISKKKKDAEDAEAKLRAAIAEGRFIPPELREVRVPRAEQISFEEFSLRYYLPWSEAEHSASHHLQQIRIIKQHLIPAFGPEKIGRINRHQIEDYMRGRLKAKYERGSKRKPIHKPVKAATVNRELACLKALFRKSMEYDILHLSPASRIRPFKEVPEKERVLADDEVVRLLEAMPDHLRAVVAVCVYGGLRRMELFKLRWQDVDLKHGTMRVVSRSENDHTKNYRTRVIAMPPDLVTHLQSHPRRLGSKLVFPNRSGNVYYKIDKQLDEAAKLAGIPEGKVRLRQLRRTYATHAQLKGGDPGTIQKQMGHRDIRTTQGYVDIASEQQQRVASRLTYILDERRDAETAS